MYAILLFYCNFHNNFQDVMIDRLTNRGNFDDIPEAIEKRCSNFQGQYFKKFYNKMNILKNIVDHYVPTFLTISGKYLLGPFCFRRFFIFHPKKIKSYISYIYVCFVYLDL